ncbi:MAG: hypothetical protein ACR2H3_02350 [Acidimicrobiales bacterium]
MVLLVAVLIGGGCGAAKGVNEARKTGDSVTTMTMAQRPPKGRWDVAEGESRTSFIDDGKDSYTCFPSGEDGATQCMISCTSPSPIRTPRARP